jgi:hypothetical protein
VSMNFASMFEFTSDEQGLMAGPNSRLTEHGDLVDCYLIARKASPNTGGDISASAQAD